MGDLGARLGAVSIRADGQSGRVIDRYGTILLSIAASVVEVAAMERRVAAGGPFYKHLWSPSQY